MALQDEKELTPMFRQYARQKAKHRDAVLFFRLGDFYEMFQSDAIEVSHLLDLTLTARNGYPMCGIPYHAAGNYISRLLKIGKKVAICEQVGGQSDGKGLSQRDVVEVITPGTVVDDAYLDEKRNNYLATMVKLGDNVAYAYIDLSTGEFCTTLLDSMAVRDSFRRELAKTTPREIIIPEYLLEREEFAFLSNSKMVLNRLPDWNFDLQNAEKRLKKQFGTISLKAFGFKSNDPRVLASGVILEYIDSNHKNLVPHIRTVTCYNEGDSTGLDESTIRNLEIIDNLQGDGSHFTLLNTLDHTKTSSGSRRLRKNLLQPHNRKDKIEQIHDRVEVLYRDQNTLASLRKLLSGIQDIERLTSRTAMDRAHGKDLVGIRNALELAVSIRDLIKSDIWDTDAQSLSELFDELKELADMLGASLLESPSILLNEGNLIREGWDSQIDHMRDMQNHGKAMLDEYIAEEKAATGMATLKLKYNRVLGYFMEVSKNQAEKAPERFWRSQTLSNVERFSTEKLQKLQTEISSVGENLVERERTLFLDIRQNVKKKIPELLEIARLLADIDLMQSYAHAATEYGYIRPQILDETMIQIKGGRHPVVERNLPPGTFVPNDIELSTDAVSFALVTGPNMAGKSTVLRQAALITLMAQAGSFVPADSAKIGIADRIFCRVGASDNLAQGESTFLVEMNETANILRNASQASLVIMDEVGRGTGTADGLAIAQAVCEYLLNQVTPRTLFATHYLELTKIEHFRMRNLSMSVSETAEKIIFPKKLIQGPAQASYGIHVAALAGLPIEVVNRARSILYQKNDVIEYRQPMLFEPTNLVLDDIRGQDMNKLTPLEALNLLDKWQKELENSNE